MARLGYDRYAAQGGDWGSAVTSAIGALDAAHCLGIHVTLAMGARPLPSDAPPPDELHALARAQFYRDWDSGYSQQQATRPQTVGYALTDSPAGQAAWILEKFWAWTDSGGDPLNVIDWRCIRRRSCRRCGAGWRRPGSTRSAIGRRCRAAGTLPPSSSRRCSWTTCAPSSARCAERARRRPVSGQQQHPPHGGPVASLGAGLCMLRQRPA